MAGGLGGVPPRNQKRGRVAHPCNPATSGAQATGEPSAYGGEQRGSRGAKPHGGGVWCPPTKPKEGARCPPLQPRHEWGPKRRQTQSPRGWANGGPGGEAPMAGGWGMCPHNSKKGGSSQPPQPCHEWDPKRWLTLGQRGWVKEKNLSRRDAKWAERG